MNRPSLERFNTKSTGTGFILSDDYANDMQYHDDTPEDDLELLAFAVEKCHDAGSDIIQFCNEEERGIIINGVPYSYKEIEHIINK